MVEKLVDFQIPEIAKFYQMIKLNAINRKNIDFFSFFSFKC